MELNIWVKKNSEKSVKVPQFAFFFLIPIVEYLIAELLNLGVLGRKIENIVFVQVGLCSKLSNFSVDISIWTVFGATDNTLHGNV